MAIRVKSTSGGGIEYQLGTQAAIIQALVVLGTHESAYPDRNGNKPMKTRVMLRFELPDSTYKNADGKDIPQVISSTYTLSLNEKSNLYPVVTAALNRKLTKEEQEDFQDLSVILGRNILVVIEQDADTKRFSIASYAAMPAAMPSRALTSPSILFDFEPDATGTIKLPEGIPQWVTEEILSSEEYQEYQSKRSVSTRVVNTAPLPTVSAAPAPKAAPVVQAAPVAAAAVVDPGLPDLSQVPDHVKHLVMAHLEAQRKAAQG